MANRRDGSWSIVLLSDVGETSTLLQRTRDDLNENQRVLIGFDFPIGYPKAFGERTGCAQFLDALPNFGNGEWSDFFSKTDNSELVSIHRPFYPRTGKPKGSTSVVRHVQALGIERSEQFRRCERRTCYRNEASPLFWTIGARQVGTAAMCGWQEILQPLIREENRGFQIWPFEGDLESITNNDHDVVVETYPGEAYSHIGFPNFWRGKRIQEERRARASNILNWTENNHVTVSGQILARIQDGFGSQPSGEDHFDAVVGMCSVIDVVEGRRREGPEDFRNLGGISNHEGWIFGQEYNEV